MKTHKYCGTILSSLTLVVALSLPWTNPLQHGQKPLGNSAQTQRADGGGPVPPLPPPSTSSMPSANQLSPLLADGGGPVPPLPPPSLSAVFLAA